MGLEKPALTFFLTHLPDHENMQFQGGCRASFFCKESQGKLACNTLPKHCKRLQGLAKKRLTATCGAIKTKRGGKLWP